MTRSVFFAGGSHGILRGWCELSRSQRMAARAREGRRVARAVRALRRRHVPASPSPPLGRRSSRAALGHGPGQIAGSTIGLQQTLGDQPALWPRIPWMITSNPRASAMATSIAENRDSRRERSLGSGAGDYGRAQRSVGASWEAASARHRPECCLTISSLSASDKLWRSAKACSASGPARYRTRPVPSVAAVKMVSAIDLGLE